MVKSITILALAYLSITPLSAQLTLDSCIAQSYRHYQFNQQIDYNQQIVEANIKGLKKNYLPSVDLNIRSTYQNEQVSIPVDLPLPGIEAPTAPLNINSALFTLNQWIYDGSMTHSQKVIEANKGDIAVQEIEVRKLELKTNVMQVYMSILLYDAQLEILEGKQKVLIQRMKEVQVAVESKVTLKSNLQLLQAEAAKLKQQIAELEFGKLESIQNLSSLMGIELSTNQKFETPTSEISSQSDFSLRPDMRLISYQSDLMEAQKSIYESNYLPRIGFFADAGVGYPGYDIFKDEISPMYKIGLSLNWHLFDWNKGKLSKENLSMNQQILAIQKSQLETQLTIQTKSQLNQINKARALMQNDEEILALYQEVTQTFASQLENGTITSATYIEQLDKEQEARSNLELHKLQLLIATLNYNTLYGQ